MDQAKSVLQRLKNKSKNSGISFQLFLQLFCQEKMLKMIHDIIDCKTENNFVNYKIKGLQSIAQHKKYHGQRVKMIGIIDKTRTPFHIDFGIGDIVIPKPEERQLNVQLEGFMKPEIYTYSLESTIAEKWDAIIDRMQFNSRMKDFYDIYYLANHFERNSIKMECFYKKYIR